MREGGPQPTSRCPPGLLSSTPCCYSLDLLMTVIKRPNGGLGRWGQGPRALMSSSEKAGTQTLFMSFPSQDSDPLEEIDQKKADGVQV